MNGSSNEDWDSIFSFGETKVVSVLWMVLRMKIETHNTSNREERGFPVFYEWFFEWRLRQGFKDQEIKRLKVLWMVLRMKIETSTAALIGKPALLLSFMNGSSNEDWDWWGVKTTTLYACNVLWMVLRMKIETNLM